MRRKLALLAVLAATAAAPALAQTPPAAGSNKVVIEAQRPEEAVRDFVAEIGATTDGANLARWDRKVCVGVVNVTPTYAQKLIDQVSLVALAVGLDPGEPGCKPNVLILADTNGDDLAARLIKDSPKAFRPEPNGTSHLGRTALRRFEKSNAPVRWWHVSETVLVDTGQSAMEARSVRVRGASRLRNNVREDLHHAIIILDTKRIGSVSFSSLADYVAMVALAPLQPLTAPQEPAKPIVRVSVVRDALVARGMAAGSIQTQARGETDLARETRDGVREPLNRRTAVTITFR